MNNNQTFLITILARGGSKRIPKKNIKNFINKPIINYPLNLIKNKFPDIPLHISSEDKEILDYVKSKGYIIDFKRPEKLASDISSSIEVINYIYKEYKKMGKDFSHIINIPPTSVFCTETIMKKSIELSKKNPGKIIIPVKEFNVPFESSYQFNVDNKQLKPVDINKFSEPTQRFSKNVYDAGILAIIPTNLLEDNLNSEIQAGNLLGLEINSLVVDIDSPNDWLLAEKVYKFLNS